jgi:hypothetical protein
MSHTKTGGVAHPPHFFQTEKVRVMRQMLRHMSWCQQSFKITVLETTSVGPYVSDPALTLTWDQ